MVRSVLDHFSTLLEIPAGHGDLIWSEVKNKIVGTYIIINGKLMFLSRVDRTGIEVSTSEDHIIMEGHKIDSIQYYLPDSGCYKFRGEYEYLQKVAKRQWKKSFSWSYYAMSNRRSEEDVFELFGQSPVSMFKRGNLIFYNRLQVASLKQGEEPTITVPDFRTEVYEFLNKEKNGT